MKKEGQIDSSYPPPEKTTLKKPNLITIKHLFFAECTFYRLQHFFFSGWSYHCVKSVRIRSYSGPYFPVFSQKCGKIGTRITLNTDNFHAVYLSELIFESQICLMRF